MSPGWCYLGLFFARLQYLPRPPRPQPDLEQNLTRVIDFSVVAFFLTSLDGLVQCPSQRENMKREYENTSALLSDVAAKRSYCIPPPEMKKTQTIKHPYWHSTTRLATRGASSGPQQRCQRPGVDMPRVAVYGTPCRTRMAALPPMAIAPSMGCCPFFFLEWGGIGGGDRGRSGEGHGVPLYEC